MRPSYSSCKQTVALLFVVGLTGCNTRFTFTSNPHIGTIGIKASVPSSTSTLAKANGAVRVVLETESVCSRCYGPGQVQHIFVPNQPATDDRVPERNASCGGTFNCIVMDDGSIQPLQLDRGSPELRITADRIEGASLLILPDTDTALTMELKLVWTWSSSAKGSFASSARAYW